MQHNIVTMWLCDIIDVDHLNICDLYKIMSITPCNHGVSSYIYDAIIIDHI